MIFYFIWDFRVQDYQKMELQKPMEEFILFLEKISPRSLDLIDTLRSYVFSYSDPFIETNNDNDMKKLWRFRLESVVAGKYHVQNVNVDRVDDYGAHVTLEWSFHYRKKARLLSLRSRHAGYVMSGKTAVEYSPDFKITEIHETWSGQIPYKKWRYLWRLKQKV